MLRRKSLHRSRNQKRARKAKSPASLAWELETRRLNRQNAAEQAQRELCAELSEPPQRPTNRNRDVLRFRVTVECLTDSQRVQITTREGPHGLTVSPTAVARQVFGVLAHYRPAKFLEKSC